MFGTPKVGLALGSGAARGLSHIGILEELERMKVPLYAITGTSIGALVGGLYASGKSGFELEELLRKANMRELLGFRAISVRSAAAIFDTKRLEAFLEKELGAVQIEDLAIKFAAVATNIANGERVMLHKGPLIKAILASIAVPALFPPVELDGKLLVDGGLVEPVPFRAARELGADIVIGVDLSTAVLDYSAAVIQEKGFWKPWHFLSIFSSAFSVMEHQLVEIQRSPEDIVLTPRVGHITPIEFGRFSEAIAAGRDEVRAWENEIYRRLGIAKRVGFFERLKRIL